MDSISNKISIKEWAQLSQKHSYECLYYDCEQETLSIGFYGDQKTSKNTLEAFGRSIKEVSSPELYQVIRTHYLDPFPWVSDCVTTPFIREVLFAHHTLSLCLHKPVVFNPVGSQEEDGLEATLLEKYYNAPEAKLFKLVFEKEHSLDTPHPRYVRALKQLSLESGIDTLQGKSLKEVNLHVFFRALEEAESDCLKIFAKLLKIDDPFAFKELCPSDLTEKPQEEYKLKRILSYADKIMPYLKSYQKEGKQLIGIRGVNIPIKVIFKLYYHIRVFLKLQKIDYYKHLPFKSIPLLVLDERVRAHKDYAFDDEYGYMAGMLYGLDTMVSLYLSGETPNKKTLDLIHTACTEGVCKKFRKGEEEGFTLSTISNAGRGEGINSYACMQALESDPKIKSQLKNFKIISSNEDTHGDFETLSCSYVTSLSFTEQGLKETLLAIRKDPRWLCVGKYRGRSYLIFLPAIPSEISYKMYEAFSQCEKTLRYCTESNIATKAIVTCCKDLEHIHPYTDGNIRSIAMVLLQWMLLRNNQPPTLLKNPNVFDGHSYEELCDIVIKGQTAFQALLCDDQVLKHQS